MSRTSYARWSVAFGVLLAISAVVALGVMGEAGSTFGLVDPPRSETSAKDETPASALGIDRRSVKPEPETTLVGWIEVVTEGVVSPLPAGEVVLAPAESMTFADDGTVTFRDFHLGSGGVGAVPTSFAEPGIRVEAGYWHSPIQPSDMAIVEVRVAGEPWRITSEDRIVRAGATTSVCRVEKPDSCQIEVVDSDFGHQLREVALMAEAKLPEDQPIVLVVGGSEEPRQPPSNFDGHGLEPPLTAALLGERMASPASFTATSYDRVLWVGSPGYEWIRTSWSVGDTYRRVALRACSELRVRVAGLDPSRRIHELSIVTRGQELASCKFRSDGVYSLRGIPVGPARLVLRRRTSAGYVAIARDRVEIPRVESFTHLVQVPEVVAGVLRVRINDPHGSLGSRDKVLVFSREDGYLAYQSAGKRLWTELVHELGGRQADGVYEVLYEDIPPGQYFVGLATLGLLRSVGVSSRGDAQVDFDVSETSSVTVLPSEESGDIVDLLWQRVEPGDTWDSSRASIRGNLDEVATHSGSEWSFRTTPGDILLVARILGSAPLVSRHRVESGSNRIELRPTDSVADELLRVTVRLARLEYRVDIVKSVIESIQTDDDFIFPSVISVRCSEAADDRGEIRVTLSLPAGSSYSFRPPDVDAASRSVVKIVFEDGQSETETGRIREVDAVVVE